MFLAKRERQHRPLAGALIGPVTLAGDPAAAYLEGERRGVAVYAPGGYHWVPGQGGEVLVVKAGENGEKPCVLGVPAKAAQLEPGEVLITGQGCSLRLGLDGTIQVEGTFLVNGTVVGPLPTEDSEEDT